MNQELITKNIATYLRFRNIPQAQIAKHLNITQQSFSRKMNNDVRLSISDYSKICELLGVEYGFFFVSPREFLVPSNSSHVVDMRHQHDSTKLNITA